MIVDSSPFPDPMSESRDSGLNENYAKLKKKIRIGVYNTGFKMEFGNHYLIL